MHKRPEDIPFTIIKDGKTYTEKEFRQAYGKKGPQKNNQWKTKAAIGLVALAGAFGIYKALQHSDDKNNSNTIEATQRSPATTLDAYDAASHFTKKDTLRLKDLSGRRAYVSIKNLTVDRDILEETRAAFEPMHLEDIIKVTGLGGLYKRYTGLDFSDHADYEQALANLWAYKKNGHLSKEFFDDADKMVREYDQETTEKTTLQEYRSFLDNHIGDLKSHFDLERMLTKPDGNKVHKEKERFMKEFYEQIDGDMMLGFSMTELYPAINPELNKIIYDKELQEAGLEYSAKKPALGDDYMSFGNFQNSSYTINPNDAASLNAYLPESKRAPQSMIYHDTKEEHATSAFLNMVYNTRAIGNVLFVNNQLTRFNDLFEQLDEDKRYLLVAGVLAAAHNNPSAAATGLVNYTDQVRQGKERAEDIVSDFQAPGVQPYYTQSIENNLILKQE